MMKHNGKYYLEYGAPGTQWNVSAMMYENPNYELRALNTDQKYYYQVQAFN